MEDPKRSLEYLKQIEAIGDEILRDRKEIIALDKRRNQRREGLRELSKQGNAKVWVNVGPALIKMDKTTTENQLKKDIKQIEVEINKLRIEVKEKVNKLLDMENKAPVPGLLLKPLSPDEISAVSQVLY